MVTVDTDLVQVTEGDTVTELTLSRPDKLNALNPEMVEGLADALDQLNADPGPGLLIDGEGRVTCAGMDRDIVGGGDYEAEYGDLNETLGRVYDLAAAYPRPVAMAGRGALIGAAAILSLCCEFLVLDEEAKYAVPEVSYGIASERITTLLPKLAGGRIAAEMVLTGEAIDPQRADEVGLANDVAPAADVTDHARELLQTVGEHDEETVASLVRQLSEDRRLRG